MFLPTATTDAKVVCFVANYSLTYFFDAVARGLQSRGIAVCWIVVNRKLRDSLTAGYGSDAVLYLSRDDAAYARRPVGDYRLNELVYGDRALCHQGRWAYSFLNNIQQPVYEFLSLNRVRFVFGELTWAHELLIHRLATARQDLGVQYCLPHTIRVPPGRFGLFTDEYQSDLLALPLPADGQSAAHESSISLEKPDYLALNDARLKLARSLRARLGRLKRYFTMENIDQKDPTLIANRWLSLRRAAAEEMNREIYRLVPKARLDEIPANRNYVFLALHKQPEASIDVTGRYYENQYTNIVNIWRALPDDWWLVVKEHSNAVGDRPLCFYRKIRKLRNVVLVDETADSHDVIRRSRAVVTVSGTVAYEAALIGIPSLTFANVFFNRIPGCRKIGLDDLCVHGLESLIQEVPANAVAAFSEWLHQHSAAGCIGDPISNPACMTAENVDRVASVVVSLLG